MSVTGKFAHLVPSGLGLVFTAAAFVGNLRWMDGEFRVGNPDTRADQLSKSTILGIQAVALVGCCLLAFAIWRWRKGSGPAGGLRITGLLLTGIAGAGLLAAVTGIITNSRGGLGEELDAMGAGLVIALGLGVAAIAGSLGAWAVRSAGYRESRAAAEAQAMGLTPGS